MGLKAPTIFPEMIDAVFKQGVVSKALEKGIISINPVNLRDYAEGRHLVTDDYQYGGGAGLVMKPEPICEAVAALRETKRAIESITVIAANSPPVSIKSPRDSSISTTSCLTRSQI